MEERTSGLPLCPNSDGVFHRTLSPGPPREIRDEKGEVLRRESRAWCDVCHCVIHFPPRSQTSYEEVSSS